MKTVAMKPWAALLLMGLLSLTVGCSEMDDPTTNMWHKDKKAAAGEEESKPEDDMTRLRRENAQLKSNQEALNKKLADMETRFKDAQEKDKAFKEMMETNFDLLEQSVAASLSKGRIAAPPQAIGKTQSAPKAAPPAAKPGKVGPKPVESMGAAAVVPLDGEDAIAQDPDLLPPSHPIHLRDDARARPLYEKGFSYFAKGDYNEAIRIFEEFVRKFPDNKYSDNAQFWVGESHFRLKRYDQAEAAYRKVLRNYEHRSTADGFKTPDAIYRIGVINLIRNKPRVAEYYLSEVVSRFPESTAAQGAKRELDALRFGTAEDRNKADSPST